MGVWAYGWQRIHTPNPPYEFRALFLCNCIE